VRKKTLIIAAVVAVIALAVTVPVFAATGDDATPAGATTAVQARAQALDEDCTGTGTGDCDATCTGTCAGDGECVGNCAANGDCDGTCDQLQTQTRDRDCEGTCDGDGTCAGTGGGNGCGTGNGRGACGGGGGEGCGIAAESVRQ
jgi:hypothetical protein